MSRFHTSKDNLEADGAMKHYRGFLPLKREGMDPAEWIEALHKEHWLVLEQLKAARADTEGERLARMLADLQFVLQELRGAQTDLGLARTSFSLVLGDTPVVEQLKEATARARRAMQTLEEIVRG